MIFHSICCYVSHINTASMSIQDKPVWNTTEVVKWAMPRKYPECIVGKGHSGHFSPPQEDNTCLHGGALNRSVVPDDIILCGKLFRMMTHEVTVWIWIFDIVFSRNPKNTEQISVRSTLQTGNCLLDGGDLVLWSWTSPFHLSWALAANYCYLL